MFKYSKIILIVLISLVTFSIGYALFSGNANISNAIDVNPVDINISTECGVVNEEIPFSDLVYTTQGIEEAQIVCSNNVIQLGATHLYPGTKQSYWIKITNNSSFDVVIKGMDVEGNVGNTIEGNRQLIEGVAYIYTQENSLVGIGLYGIENYTGGSQNGLACIKEEDCVISPGETYTVTFTDTLSEDLEGNSIDAQINRTMQVNIEQHN